MRDAYTEISNVKIAPRPANGIHKSPSPEESYSDLEGAVGGAVEVLEPTDIEEILQKETARIMELFPDFGVGYIRRLLAYYDSSAEKVIAAILEGNLAPGLTACDQNEPYIPPEIPDKVFAATGLERSNVYDGDEFDVMRIEEFTGVVMKNGRIVSKKVPRNLNDLLNDKSHLKPLQERYLQYSLVNDCKDGVDCSEVAHQLNRRSIFKVLKMQ